MVPARSWDPAGSPQALLEAEPALDGSDPTASKCCWNVTSCELRRREELGRVPVSCHHGSGVELEGEEEEKEEEEEEEAAPRWMGGLWNVPPCPTSEGRARHRHRNRALPMCFPGTFRTRRKPGHSRRDPSDPTGGKGTFPHCMAMYKALSALLGVQTGASSQPGGCLCSGIPRIRLIP